MFKRIEKRIESVTPLVLFIIFIWMVLILGGGLLKNVLQRM